MQSGRKNWRFSAIRHSQRISGKYIRWNMPRSFKPLVRCAFAMGSALTGGCLQGQAYPVHHPVFPATVSPADAVRLRQETALVMGFTPAEMDDWIVARTSIENIACPNCRGGTP